MNLSYCTIRSPIEGLAGKRDVAPGNLVGRGDATLLTTVSSINPIRVVLSISEAEYLRFRYASEPMTSAWRRFQRWLYSLLPIEPLL